MEQNVLEELFVKLVQKTQKDRTAGEPEEVVRKEFKEKLKSAIQENRFIAADTIIKSLQHLTDEGNCIDPSRPDGKDIDIWCWFWVTFLEELGDPISAEKVIEACYNHLLWLQSQNKKRYHKGAPLYNRAKGLIQIGQWQKAKRFVILAYIEDVITKQKTAPAWQTLKSVGVSDKDLDLIESETNNLMESYAGQGHLPFYPEEVFQKVHYQIEFATIGEISKDIVYTNSEYLKHLMELVENASINDEKKTTLENLAQYLFSSIDGLYVEPPKRTGPYELDGIISNSSEHPFLRTLDKYIPIECKNWKEPVGSPEITQFIGKLSLFKCHTGILLSKEGISGTVNELRKDAYRRSDIYVLVFSSEDIKKIIEGTEDLISLMLAKFKELKFSIRM